MIRKTVIITGAVGGIGRATALKFAKNGYNIGLVWHSKSPESLENEIRACGVDVYNVRMNISDEKDVVRGFEEFISHFDYIDCLVCAAGVADPERLLIDRTERDISRIIDLNLKGLIYCNREMSKYFINKKHGNIVNISSILGKVGCTGEVVYSASKAGIIGFTKALSKEVGGYGVRVNAVAPGMIKTDMTAGFSQQECEVLKASTSLKRLGEPEDVADVIYFLASNEARFITGECVEVSGGLLI